MAFIPHTEADVAAMLAAIGAARIEDLFDEIPPQLRIRSLAGVPEALNEMEVGRLMSERAAADGTALSFLGAGAYEHHIPAAVWAITTRGEFYSAYTPYQAEASQGTLQLIYEFQTMMARLTAMEAANASMYDGASAMGEAALMAVRANRKSKAARILVPASVHPYYRRVAHALTCNQGLSFDRAAVRAAGGHHQCRGARPLRRHGHHCPRHPAAELLRPSRGRGYAHRLGARARHPGDRGRQSHRAGAAQAPGGVGCARRRHRGRRGPAARRAAVVAAALTSAS